MAGYLLPPATVTALLAALNADASAQRPVSQRPLSAAFDEASRSVFYQADWVDFGPHAVTVGVPSVSAANSRWSGLRPTVPDTAIVSWPRVFGTTALGALAGHAVSWRLINCGFDERDTLCSGNDDLLLVPAILTPVVSVSGAAMLAGADLWRSVGGTTLGILGSGLTYALGIASGLPLPAIAGLAALTHAGIATLVVIP